MFHPLTADIKFGHKTCDKKTYHKRNTIGKLLNTERTRAVSINLPKKEKKNL